MDVYGCTKTKYDIPLNHLDYSYVSKCQDTKELEKIIKILRSGKEGSYPDLEKCAEERLASLDPLNKLLRKPDSLKTPRDLGKEEWQEINEDLENWVQDVRVADEKLGHVVDEKGNLGVLPPVRSTAANIDSKKTSSSESTSRKSEKRVKPRDYREWDKFDIEAELEKADSDDKSKVNHVKQSNKPSVSETIDKSGCNDEVTQMRAEREKNKGNEAFRSGDYDEAIVYYNRSLALIETVASRNNRAQAYIKLKKWNQALDDCEFVLKVEPTNLKALLRRAVANQGLARYDHAKRDIEAVLQKEPNNKQALEVKKSVDKVLADWKTTGRRMVIEEVDGSDSEEDESQTNTKNIQKSTTSTTTIDDSDKTSSVKKSNIKADSPDTVVTNYNDEKVATATDTVDTDKKKSAAVVSSGDISTQDSVLTDASRQSSQGSLASGDVTSEPLPPAVQALKDDGNDLFRKGQYGDALDKYTAAIQVLTGLGRDVVNLSTLYSNRAACLMKVGDCQGCIIDCDSALALYPGSTKPLLRRAMAYETLEKYRQAYVDYRQVLLSDSTVEAAQQGADRCSNMLQRLDGSGWRDKLPTVSSSSNLAGLAAGYQATESQSSINEKTFETCKAQGNSLFSKGDFVMAIDLFAKCIELFPDRVVPYTNRALCYLRLEKYDAVLSDCNQALSIEFHNVKALFRRAQAYKMLERYEECMIDLETLLKIDSSNVAAKKELQTVVKLKNEKREKRLQASLRKHRQRVRIEEVDTSSDEELPGKKPVETKSDAAVNCQSGNVKTPKPKASTVPILSKVSAFEFMQAWGSLKGISDVEPYVKILDQVQPADLPKLITNKLDSDLLFTVVRCAGHLIARGEAQRAYEFLNSLTLLSRFETIAMFLSESEKKELSNVFHQLSTSSDVSFNSTQISSIRQKYGL